MEKRYYWLQLRGEFFTQKEIKKLRKIAGGDTYTIIYLKMLLVAIKQGNKLYFEGVEETFPEELALELDEDVENVKVTLNYLKRQGLLQVLSETEFSLIQCEEMVGSETDAARRKRASREKQKQASLECKEDLPKLPEPVDVEPEQEEPEPKKKASGYTPDFEQFWLVYPRKVGKGEAYKKYKARLNDGFSEAELLEAATNYAAQCKRDRTEEKYIKHGKTFLSENTPFLDYIKNEAPTDVTESSDDEENPFKKG